MRRRRFAKVLGICVLCPAMMTFIFMGGTLSKQASIADIFPILKMDIWLDWKKGYFIPNENQNFCSIVFDLLNL